MHIPFTFVLTLVTLSLSCVPAILIWTIFLNLMNSTVDLLSMSATSGTNALSNSVQNLLLDNSLNLLNVRLTAGDKEAVSQETLLYATGLVNLNLRPNVTDLKTQVLDRIRGYNFNALVGNTRLSYISMEGTYFNNNASPGKTSYWIVWQTVNIDIMKAQMGAYPYGRTLYLCTVQLSQDEQVANMQIWYVDQTTGTPLFQLSSTNYPWQAFAYPAKEYRKSWGSDLYINPYSGLVELTYVENIQAGDQQFSQGLGLNTQTLSEELRSQLAGQPNDRLFLFFRNAKGHLIAASHGKYFSLSDVDLRYENMIANPPNLSAYSLYTCLDSTDALILEACQTLVALYGNWTRIPESRQEMALAGRRYWVAVGYSTSTLEATMVLLKDRQAIMGGIDASTTTVQRDTDNKQGAAAVVFGVAMAVTGVLSLLSGVWLSHRLLLLARGMDSIAKLDFRRSSLPQALFQEIHDFQQSFLQMERGLRAFGKFVPSAVVTRLVAGNIDTDDKMETATVTIMFADIERFSLLAETMPPSQLAEVCTEYFETMCKHVVDCEGTVDKFIGDCVMALWNVPLPRPGHERSAVTAALRMQAEVLVMHDVWRRRGLPALKFRLGLHTGSCLVGNFGCSHRISYTCLGDNVNLASRLEALNKKFDTVLCVSEATYAACKEDFHFRRLAKVTVPGRAEALAVYEVLCSADAGPEAAEACGPPALAYPRSPCSPGDVLLGGQLEAEATRMAAAGGKGKAAAPYQVAKDERIRVVEVASNAGSADQPEGIPYHWGWHPWEAVLKGATEYEAAYAVLVEGRCAACRAMVPEPPPDKSWQTLASQLDEQARRATPWDGVLRFSEK